MNQPVVLNAPFSLPWEAHAANCISCDNSRTFISATCLNSLFQFISGNTDTEGGLGGAHIGSERAKKQFGCVQVDWLEQGCTQNFLTLVKLHFGFSINGGLW